MLSEGVLDGASSMMTGATKVGDDFEAFLHIKYRNGRPDFRRHTRLHFKSEEAVKKFLETEVFPALQDSLVDGSLYMLAKEAEQDPNKPTGLVCGLFHMEDSKRVYCAKPAAYSGPPEMAEYICRDCYEIIKTKPEMSDIFHPIN